MPGGGTLGDVLSMLKSRMSVSYNVSSTSAGVSEDGEIEVAYDVSLYRKTDMKDPHERCQNTYYISKNGPFGTFIGKCDNVWRVTCLDAPSAETGFMRILRNETAMYTAFGLPAIKSASQLRILLDISGK